jgi:hypothetical protein
MRSSCAEFSKNRTRRSEFPRIATTIQLAATGCRRGVLVRNRWKRVAGPAIGLSAVMAALAIIAGAPIVLFTDDDPLEAASPPAAASSQVSQVTTSPANQNEPATPRPPRDLGEATTAAADTTVVTGSSPTAAPASPTDGLPPLAREPAGGDSSGEGRDRPSDGDAATQGGRDRQGKAKGHDKSHGQGNANGHDKWHGTSGTTGSGNGHSGSVAFSPPRGEKHGHVSHSGAGKHTGRGHRPHARPRG